MKKFELFGLSLTIKYNRNKSDNVEEYTDYSYLREKLSYLLLMIAVFVISSTAFNLSNSKNYVVGEVVVKNIYSPKSILFNDKNKKQEIISNLIENSKKEYIFVPEVKDKYLESANSLFNELTKNKSNKHKINLEIIEDNIGKNIDENLIKNLTNLDKTNLSKVKKNVITFLEKAYTTGIMSEQDSTTISPPNDILFLELSPLEKEIVLNFIAPNYIFDEVKTKNSILEKIAQIDEQIVNIEAGTLLVKKGEIINEDDIEILDAVGIQSFKKNIVLILATITYCIMASSVFYPLLVNNYKKYFLNKNIYKSIFLICFTTFLVYRFASKSYLYLIPFESLLFLMTMLYTKAFTIVVLSLISIFLFPIIGFDPIFILITFLTAVVGSYSFDKITTRQSIITLGFKLAAIKFFLYLLFVFFIGREQNLIILQGSEIIISGLLSGIITIAVLPYFERTFNILTTFQLLELGDLSHPLLKLLSLTAPGTLQHSMTVATLAEAAAEAIGANAIFTRVASYYHDVGKIKRPSFFVENQENVYSPHLKLSPTLSSLIILSHTKEGYELGKEYNIPKEIRDIMLEHHGTTFVAYFYNKAKQQNLDVTENSFRYSGPIPSSKESAIIMLADSIEAAARSLNTKNSTTISNLLEEIVASKIAEGQLVNANLTFKEIEIIVQTFTKVLLSIYHTRIKYPGQK